MATGGTHDGSGTRHEPDFVCIDCGSDIYVSGFRPANDDDLCVMCSWLRGVENPQDREGLRRFLNLRTPST